MSFDNEPDTSGRNHQVVVYYDHNTSKVEKNNYYMKPLFFNGDAAQFSWWKSKMYNHIVGIDDELWDIVEDSNAFKVDEE